MSSDLLMYLFLPGRSDPFINRNYLPEAEFIKSVELEVRHHITETPPPIGAAENSGRWFKLSGSLFPDSSYGHLY